MGTTATRMTVEEFRAITVEGDRKQLVDGEIIVNEPKLIHGVLQARIAIALGNWIEAGDGRGIVCMPTDVELDEHNLFGPDIIWIAERHRPQDLRRYLERVPDICVEIRSPGTWRYEIGAKKAAYERGGLPELWLVDDRRPAVLVFRRSAPDVPTFDVVLELGVEDELTSPQLPGFVLPLGRLFAD